MNSAAFWRELRDVAPFAPRADLAVWRISVPPAAGPATAARIAARLHIEVFYDWAGGLIWLATAPSGDAGAAIVRGAIASADGHATLMRAPDPIRAAVDVFEPPANGIARLSARVKASFDPRGILNPGRIYAGS